MLGRKNKDVLIKIFSMFSVMRAYNIWIIIIAQYLSAIFVLAPEHSALSILLDINMFLIVLATALCIASGYIINNFYDREKDIINRPYKTKLDRVVSEETRLKVYFGVNLVVFLIALIVSLNASLFFSAYIFLIWFYSHKLKKFPIIGNITASFLAILPFFAILFYYQKQELFNIQYHKYKYFIIFAHASFVYLLILIRELVKDLENIKGDFANNYRTIAVVYGEETSKKIITFLCMLTLIPAYVLIDIADVGYMDIYIYLSLFGLLIFSVFLWKSEKKYEFTTWHFFLKILIILGVFSVVLIEPSLLWKGRELLNI